MKSVLPEGKTLSRFYDEKNLNARHKALTADFAQLPPIKCFLIEVRRKRIARPNSAELSMLSDVKPSKTSGVTLPGHIRCDVTETPTRAWPVGAIGNVDCQLYITEKGAIMSLTNCLQYDGMTVICAKNRFPIKGLVPFDISVYCDDHVYEILNRINDMAHQNHNTH